MENNGENVRRKNGKSESEQQLKICRKNQQSLKEFSSRVFPHFPPAAAVFCLSLPRSFLLNCKTVCRACDVDFSSWELFMHQMSSNLAGSG